MAIAESLGIHQTGSRPVLDLLKDYLREADPSPVLLLLDNLSTLWLLLPWLWSFWTLPPP